MGKRTAVAKAPALPQSALAANLAIVDKGNYQTFNTKKILGFIGEGWDCLYYSLGNSSLDLMRHSPSLIGFYCMLYLKVKFLMYSKSSKNILYLNLDLHHFCSQTPCNKANRNVSSNSHHDQV